MKNLLAHGDNRDKKQVRMTIFADAINHVFADKQPNHISSDPKRHISPKLCSLSFASCISRNLFRLRYNTRLERHLFYVAFSRARENVWVSCGGLPSEFLIDLSD